MSGLVRQWARMRRLARSSWRSAKAPVIWSRARAARIAATTGREPVAPTSCSNARAWRITFLARSLSVAQDG